MSEPDFCPGCPFTNPACDDCRYQGGVPGQTDLLDALEEK